MVCGGFYTKPGCLRYRYLMTQEEFEEKFSAMEAKLTEEENEMIQQIISGAEINNTILFVCIGVALGALLGVLGTLLVVS